MFHSRSVREIAAGVFVLALFVAPAFTWAGKTKQVYVDAHASGKQDGSSEHPYKTISAGLKSAKHIDELHVANGVYKENIEIPEDVKLFGEDDDKTIIEAKNNDKPAVIMNHKTTLDKFTVKGGEHGVYVSKDSRASIVHSIIRDSKKDGIRVRDAKVSDKYAVSIIDSEVMDNNRAGIYSEKRRVVLINTFVHDNDNDGVDIATGSKAWIDNNKLSDNRGSGLKVSLDNSTILVAGKNTFRDNKHEGVEINGYGKTGTVSIVKSRFINNKHYGIARIARNTNVSNDVWKGFTQKNNIFTSNNSGEVSPILHIQ